MESKKGCPILVEIGWIGRQILNGSQVFFLYNILIFIYFFKYESIETHAQEVVTLIILAIARTSESVFQLNGIDL